MRTFIALICTLALACVANGAQDENKQKKGKKKQAQTAHHEAGPQQKGKGAQHMGRPQGHPTANVHHQGPKTTKSTSMGASANKTREQTNVARKGGAQSAQEMKKNKGQANVARGGRQANAKPFKTQRFNLQTKTRPTTVKSVTFVQNRRIVGSQNWVGPRYTVFRTYNPVWHDTIWWNSHFNRIVFVFGGWYYWNAGWWYPAWGYAPGAYYAYDGPIYAYNGLPPDQVTANVQTALQQQGYYQGEVDGLLGPITRDALANYQRDHGLYETAAIDQPTLESLGMS